METEDKKLQVTDFQDEFQDFILKVENLRVIPTKDVMIKLSQRIMAISLSLTVYILLRTHQDGVTKE